MNALKINVQWSTVSNVNNKCSSHCYPEGECNVYSHFLKTVLENLKIFTDLLSKFPFLQYKKQRKIQALQFLLKSSANWIPEFSDIWLVNVTFSLWMEDQN